MGQHSVAKAPSVTSTKMVRATKTITRAQRGRFASIWVVGLSIFVVAAIAGVFVVRPIPMPTGVSDKSISGIEEKRVGSIIVRRGDNNCEHKSFDNQTGEIAVVSAVCSQGVTLDAKGVPVPTGTIRTMSSISKSFR